MIQVIRDWFAKHFSDPEAILLFILLALGFTLIVTLGNILTPLLAGLVFAYFLRWFVVFLEAHRVPKQLSYLIVYIGFLAVFISALFFFLPMLWRQVISLLEDLPGMIQKSREFSLRLGDIYPEYISQTQVDKLITGLMQDINAWGKTLLSFSLSSIPGVITWVVYAILVPLIVFFLLKDNDQIRAWFSTFLPEKRRLLKNVWVEMDQQIGNYIRGKVAEITIVGIATYLVFLYFHLNYAALLAFLVGLSVVIPYVGAVAVTIPVALVAFLQWGWGSEFAYLLISYFVVQALDGNLLVPLLFSEAVNLHPIAIITAILFFGSIWGFWGVFFAIPLATLFKAVLNAWPSLPNKKA